MAKKEQDHGYVADDSDLPEIFSDGPRRDRMADARARVRSVCQGLGLQPTSEDLTLCAIVLVAIAEDDAAGKHE